MVRSTGPDSELGQNELEARRAMFERIGRKVAECNDEAVAKTVASRKPIGSVYNIDQAGLLDAFLAFLREIGWMKEEEDEESLYDVSTRMSHVDSSDEPLGVRRWRCKLGKAVADYVIAFQGAYYGIFHLTELSVLAGYTLRLLPEELGTREQILACYGLDSPTQYMVLYSLPL